MRVKKQYDEAEEVRIKEADRLRVSLLLLFNKSICLHPIQTIFQAEMETLRASHAAELASVKEAAGEQLSSFRA